MSPRRRRLLLAGAAALAVTVADQATKAWAVQALNDGVRGDPLPTARRAKSCPASRWLCPPRYNAPVQGGFHFRYSVNTGSAFGLFQGWGGALTLVGLGALGYVLWLLWRHPLARYRAVAALGLIAGGAVGNLADRFRQGHVVDFILWHVGDRFYWPTFNIADASLCVGVAMIILWPERSPAEDPAPAASAASDGRG